MKRFDELSRFKREKDTGVKLEAMIASKGDFAAVQISEYIPYTYEAVTGFAGFCRSSKVMF